MAEVFGLAAAGIGVTPVALELAKSFKKLKDYCRDVKSSREDIQNFKDEVDVLGTVLAQLDSLDLAQCPSSSASLQRCYELCTKANKTLSSIISELQDGLKTQGRRTQLVFPLKKEKVKQLTDKVGTARNTLTLACNVYLLWQSKALAMEQRQMQATVVASIEAHRHDHNRRFDDLLSEHHITRQSLLKEEFLAPRSRTGSSKSVVAMRPIDSDRNNCHTRKAFKIWDLCTFLATQGWTRYFRSYRIVDRWTDPAFLAIRKDDLVTLQRMICDRQATIYDQGQDHETMLTVCYSLVYELLPGLCTDHLQYASMFSPSICQWLVQMGAGRNVSACPFLMPSSALDFQSDGRRATAAAYMLHPRSLVSLVTMTGTYTPPS